MEESGHFNAFFDGSDGDTNYHHHLSILDHEDGLPEIVKAIAERIMERVRSNNIDVLLDVDDIPVPCTIPKEHLVYLLSEFILKSSQISNKRITVVAEEFSVKNNSRAQRTDVTIKRNDSTFTKGDYDLLVRLLKAKVMQFAVDDGYMKTYIRAHDPHDESVAISAIVKFINDNVFWKDDIAYANIFNATHVPRLFMIQEELTIHAFVNDHPLVVEQQVVIAKDLSNCFVKLTVAELYSELLTIINCVPLMEREIAIVVESEDDYDYIDLLTKNSRNGIVGTIYHPTLPFVEACKRFYKEAAEVDMIYDYRSNDPLIKQLITLHDLQYGLIDDQFEYPEHPPEDEGELPKALKPILYRIGKKAL